MCAIAPVHLDFFRDLHVSRPDTWAHIQVPYERTQTHSSIDQLGKPRFHTSSTYTCNGIWNTRDIPVEHTYAKRKWPPQNESKRWLWRQTRRQWRLETVANVDGPTHLLSVQQRAHQAPPNPPPHNLPSREAVPTVTQGQLMVIFWCPTSWSRSSPGQRIHYPHKWHDPSSM